MNQKIVILDMDEVDRALRIIKQIIPRNHIKRMEGVAALHMYLLSVEDEMGYTVRFMSKKEALEKSKKDWKLVKGDKE